MICAFMIPQTAVDCNARPGDLPQLAGEVGQSFRDFELLGHTASQLRQPMQAAGRFSSGRASTAMGAMKPPPVKVCSL